MTPERAKEIMQIERTCVLRQDTPKCNRDECGCQNCDLILDTDEVVAAYDTAIKVLKDYQKLEMAYLREHTHFGGTE